MAEKRGGVRRWFTRSREKLTSQEVTERLKKVEQAIELQYLGKPQSEITHATGTAAAELIAALETTSRAVLQLGSLLIVKTTDTSGRSAIFVRTLGLKELTAIETDPSLLARPEDVLSLLGNPQDVRRLTASSDSDD
jgi:hypothetical protein